MLCATLLFTATPTMGLKPNGYGSSPVPSVGNVSVQDRAWVMNYEVTEGYGREFPHASSIEVSTEGEYNLMKQVWG